MTSPMKPNENVKNMKAPGQTLAASWQAEKSVRGAGRIRGLPEYPITWHLRPFFLYVGGQVVEVSGGDEARAGS